MKDILLMGIELPDLVIEEQLYDYLYSMRGKDDGEYYYLKPGDCMKLGDELYQYARKEEGSTGNWSVIQYERQEAIYKEDFTACRRKLDKPTKEEIDYLIKTLEL